MNDYYMYALAAAAAHRGRLAARAGRHHALRQHDREPRRQPARRDHDADRLPAGAGAALRRHHRGADPRLDPAPAGGRGAALVGASAPPSSRSSASSCPASSSATSASRPPTARSSSTARTTPTRADPPTVRELFANVRRNYFRLYFHYMYFNVARIFYLQIDNVFGYVILAPAIVAGAITLGLMNQILNALGQVRSSFQYLVNSWTTVVELLSIYKRLRAFEADDPRRAAAHDRPRLPRRHPRAPRRPPDPGRIAPPMPARTSAPPHVVRCHTARHTIAIRIPYAANWHPSDRHVVDLHELRDLRHPPVADEGHMHRMHVVGLVGRLVRELHRKAPGKPVLRTHLPQPLEPLDPGNRRQAPARRPETPAPPASPPDASA